MAKDTKEERKPFLLRIPPDLWVELEKWAATELRSVNGQIEWLVSQKLKEQGRLKTDKDETNKAKNTGKNK